MLGAPAFEVVTWKTRTYKRSRTANSVNACFVLFRVLVSTLLILHHVARNIACGIDIDNQNYFVITKHAM